MAVLRRLMLLAVVTETCSERVDPSRLIASLDVDVTVAISGPGNEEPPVLTAVKTDNVPPQRQFLFHRGQATKPADDRRMDRIVGEEPHGGYEGDATPVQEPHGGFQGDAEPVQEPLGSYEGDVEPAQDAEPVQEPHGGLEDDAETVKVGQAPDGRAKGEVHGEGYEGDVAPPEANTTTEAEVKSALGSSYEGDVAKDQVPVMISNSLKSFDFPPPTPMFSSFAFTEDHPYDERAAYQNSLWSTVAYCGAGNINETAATENVIRWTCGPPCIEADAASPVRLTEAKMLVVSEVNDALRLKLLAVVAVVARRSDSTAAEPKCQVIFRGTSNLVMMLIDLESGIQAHPPWASWKGRCDQDSDKITALDPGCLLGLGFIQGYGAIREKVYDALRASGCHADGASAVHFTGHSLGAAYGQIGMFDAFTLGYKVAGGYFFGSPRAGNKVWARTFSTLMPDVPVYRVTLGQDPVARLGPLRFLYQWAHMGVEVFYPDSNESSFSICDAQEWSYGGGKQPACGQFSMPIRNPFECAQDAGGHCDHLHYFRFVHDTPPVGSVTCAQT